MIGPTIRRLPGLRTRGASIVEFALIAPILFFMLFAIIEVGLLFWVNLTMQYAVREGARYAVTGQTNLDPDPTGQQRYRAVIRKIKESSMGLYEQVKPEIIVNNFTYANAGQYNANMFGGPNDSVVLQLDCTWAILTPMVRPFFNNGEYRFKVAATMRNEAF